VAALKDLYSNRIRSGVPPKRADPKLPVRHHFDWTFRDKPPSLPALARSARSGCLRCALLRSAISIPRGSSSGDNAGAAVAGARDISLRFYCVANSRLRAGGMPLKEVQELSIGSAAPTGHADSKPWGAIHVSRSDGEMP